MKWKEVPISQVCVEAVDCVNRTAPVVDYETPYKMIRTTNVKGGFIDTRNVKCVTQATYEKWTRRLVPQVGDVVLTREAPVGEVGRVTTDEKIFLGQRLFHYRANPTVLDGTFLAYVLQSHKVRGRILSMGLGATVEHVKVADALKILIPIPPIEIQQTIGNTLAAYDELVENNTRRINLLERSARLLFEEWFIRLRYPGHEHDKIVNGVPEGWERAAIPSMIDINPREPSKQAAELWYVPMSALSVSGMTLDAGDFERRSKPTGVKFRNGDTLFARITPCLENGKTGFVDFLENGEIACGSTEFIVLRGKVVSPEFTYCISRSDYFRGTAIKSMIGSSGRQRVQEDCFNEFVVAVSPRSIMADFDEFASHCFLQSRNLRRQNERLVRARDLLLPRLMDGRIEV